MSFILIFTDTIVVLTINYADKGLAESRFVSVSILMRNHKSIGFRGEYGELDFGIRNCYY